MTLGAKWVIRPQPSGFSQDGVKGQDLQALFPPELELAEEVMRDEAAHRIRVNECP